VPEIIGQPIVDKLYHVFRSGEPLELKAEQVSLQRNGKKVNGYYDVSYRALHEDGQITGILGIAIDVTTQIVALQELEASDEKLKIAIETGKMGTWSIDLDSLIIETSEFVKKLLGLQPQKTYVIADFLSLINPSFQQTVTDVLGNALRDHKTIDISYPVQNLLTGEEKWLRVTGKALLGGNYKAAQFTGLLIDITQQKADEQRKNDFIGMVSHELKTPLTSLSAIVQMANVKLKKSEDAFLSGAMEKANVQVKRMGNMINGFLNISRLESAKLLIDKNQFNLVEVIQDIINETQLTTSGYNIQFKPGKEILVNADKDKIISVITNLISNAIKYSPKGKTIQIGYSVINDEVQVTVKDEGMGIKAQDRNKVFDRYYRVQSTHTQHISGFGIGLYLSAEIIQRHDGKIWVESESGKGSTFYFTLPI